MNTGLRQKKGKWRCVFTCAALALLKHEQWTSWKMGSQSCFGRQTISSNGVEVRKMLNLEVKPLLYIARESNRSTDRLNIKYNNNYIAM